MSRRALQRWDCLPTSNYTTFLETVALPRLGLSEVDENYLSETRYAELSAIDRGATNA